MGIVTLNDQLTETLLGRTRRALLSVLYGHADERFYLRQLVRTTGGGVGAVQRELKVLAEAGIIKCVREGKQLYYQANARSAVFPELKSLILKTAGLGDALKTALAPLAERIGVAFVYGSIAGGNEKKGSDVDLFVIGDVAFSEVIEALGSVQRTLNREINPVVYPVAELQRKRAMGHPFIQSVLAGDKVFLVGDEDDLARLAS